jgi:hypothetical protein
MLRPEVDAGDMPSAGSCAARGLWRADRGRHGLWHIAARTTLADVLRQSDRTLEALMVVREGETPQAGITPRSSTRHSRRGCHDGDLLLAEAERWA